MGGLERVEKIDRTVAWVEEIGRPMKAEVEGLKRAFWWAGGAFIGAGVILGLIGPYILKKLGLG